MINDPGGPARFPRDRDDVCLVECAVERRAAMSTDRHGASARRSPCDNRCQPVEPIIASLSNAAKFMPARGRVPLAARKTGREIVVSVRDDWPRDCTMISRAI